jgi:insulysin
MEGHPWRKFGTGSKESLLESARRSTKAFPAENDNSDSNSGTELDGGAAGRFLRSKLIEWWKSQYCARRMKAAILGSSEFNSSERRRKID